MNIWFCCLTILKHKNYVCHEVENGNESNCVIPSQANESAQCVSREEFQALREQLTRSREETAAIRREVDSWQNSTILILKRYLIENPSKLIKYMGRLEFHLQLLHSGLLKLNSFVILILLTTKAVAHYLLAFHCFAASYNCTAASISMRSRRM